MAGEGVVIKEVAPKGLIVGEGPHWLKESQCLLFVDIQKSVMYRLFTETGRLKKLTVVPSESGHAVTFIVPVADQPDLFILGHGRSLALMEWPESDPDTHTKQVKVSLHTVESHTPTNRFNDGKCDPQGRLWAGTMAHFSSPLIMEKEKGHLFCLKSDLTLETVLDKISLSNGLCWSQDKTTAYYIDSLTYSVDAFDYDDATAKIDNRRQILDFKAEGLVPDFPDGMCMDCNGNLWVACFLGAKVICIDPATRQVTRKVTMPTQNITSVCFGGDDFGTLFVTSSSLGLTPEEIKSQPAGATFAVTGLGVKGMPPKEFKIDEWVLKQRLA